LQWVSHNIPNSTDYDWHNSNWTKMFTELMFKLKIDHWYEKSMSSILIINERHTD
jgi:hypothetical protein